MENLAERNGPKRPTLIEYYKGSLTCMEYQKLQYSVSDKTWDNFEAKKQRTEVKNIYADSFHFSV